MKKHRDILEAIKSGDTALSEKAVRTILDEALELIDSRLEKECKKETNHNTPFFGFF